MEERRLKIGGTISLIEGSVEQSPWLTSHIKWTFWVFGLTRPDPTA